MMKLIFFVCSILAEGGILCCGQTDGEVDCVNKPAIQFDRIRLADRIEGKVQRSTGTCVLRFMSEFNDSIRVFVNDTLRFKDHVKTNQMISDADKFVVVSYAKSKMKGKQLRVTIEDRRSCCSFYLKRRYAFIYIFMSEPDHWTIRFSNVSYVH